VTIRVGECHSYPEWSPNDFRLFYQRDVRLLIGQNIRTSFGRSQKMFIDRVLTLEYYTCNKVFVSRDGITAFAYVSTPHMIEACVCIA
jgi:hypothetical protein